MLGEMVNLETKFPEICNKFVMGNFAAQLNDDKCFSRCETDKVTEITINKEIKSCGGTTRFSINGGAVEN